MRKLISILLLFSMINIFAYAAPIVTTKDAESDIINISNPDIKNGKAMLTVFNPGCDSSDIPSDADKSLQYFGTSECTDKGYSFDIEMNVLSDGGTYTAVVTANGLKETFSFSFYPYETKINLIKELNKASNAQTLNLTDVLDKLLMAYNLNNFELTSHINKSDLANILINERGAGFPLDVQAMYNTLNLSINLAALNSSVSAAFSGNKVKYSELLCLNDQGLEEDYKNINAQGLIYIKNALSGKGFTKNSDAVSVFKSQVVLQLIQNNAKHGSGHVSVVLSDYSSYLLSQGFNLSKISSIKNKSAFYDYLANSNVADLPLLMTRFNSYTEDGKKPTSGGNSGLSGGSVSSNPGSAQTYVPAEPSLIFDDVPDSHWAKEPIEKLYSLGIINGKSNKSFDPDGQVTRAEFTKMIVMAAGITSESSTLRFSDISSHWSEYYVGIASANGIVSGVDENLFMPDSFISREQGAAIIYRAAVNAGAEFTALNAGFTDEDKISLWAADAVNALYSKGIIKGREDGSFAPLQNLTRAEAAKIIYYSLDLLNSK